MKERIDWFYDIGKAGFVGGEFRKGADFKWAKAPGKPGG
jgi:hypothetical protein